MNDFKKHYKKLYHQIDELLWQDWDPLGLNDIETLRGEYASYTAKLVSLVINKAEKQAIMDLLYRIAKDNMSIEKPDIEVIEKLADKVLNIK